MFYVFKLRFSVNYSQVPLKPQVVPQADQPVPTEMWKGILFILLISSFFSYIYVLDQDWSYLHLRPNNPAPLSMSEVTNKYVTSLMLSPQFFYYPQVFSSFYFIVIITLLTCYSVDCTIQLLVYPGKLLYQLPISVFLPYGPRQVHISYFLFFSFFCLSSFILHSKF